MLRKCVLLLFSTVLLVVAVTPGCAPDLSLGEDGLRFCQASAECVQRLGANFECRMRLCQRITATCTGAGTPCKVPGQKGICESGRTRCQGGELVCEPINTKQPKEICGNQLDDDCDGIIDNPQSCACQPGDRRPCYPSDLKGCVPDSSKAEKFNCIAPCATGLQVCGTDAVWTACSNFTTPGQEFCDGIDNDCNGQVDDTFPNKGDVCRTNSKGPCESGESVCDNGKVVCKQTTQPSKEICDGKDNDCDGLVDNDPSCVCKPNETQACYTGPAGTAENKPCQRGIQKCVNGKYSEACEGEVKPESETCDGVDNNCNGTVDEIFPGKDSPCVDNTRKGVCQAGVKACENGKEICRQTTASSIEICDGKDNDCDGQIDNRQGQPCTCTKGETRSCYTGPSNTKNKAPCKDGTQTCQDNGTYGACVGEVTPQTEECDGKDNNCNGQIDESFTNLGIACTLNSQQGVCAIGKLACVSGKETCQQTTTASAEICDAKDNDCNGQVDDNVSTNGAACDTGLKGECAKGTLTCVSGKTECKRTFTVRAEVCDGLDNDCDGTVDENPTDAGSSCTSASICGTGTNTCVAGKIVCSGGGASVEICDGKDNDCDGQIDESTPTSPCANQTGACAGSTQICNRGVGVVVCNQNQYNRENSKVSKSAKEVCGDAADNDCDGDVDEGCSCTDGTTRSCYSGPTGSESNSPCKAGTQTCSGGAWGPCTGEVLPKLEVCNGIDDNCNGTIDEGLTAIACYTGSSGCTGDDRGYTCVGACRAGIGTCAGGRPSNCQGVVAPTADTSVNGVDEDCNGKDGP